MNFLKVLFVHDHVFHVDANGSVYSGGGLPSKIWSRYLKYFSSITVVGRKAPFLLTNEEREHYALSSTESVTFNLLENISGIKARIKNKNRVAYEIKNLVSAHDAIIARLTSELGLLVIAEAKKQGKPWAVELVDCPWDALWGFGTLTAKIYAPILALRVRRALLSSTHALYVTEHFLQSRYPSRSGSTIACSNAEIPDNDISVLASRQERISLLSPHNKITFGLLGSLNGKLKGIHIALKAFSLIKDQMPQFEFRILGGGDPTPWKTMARQLGIEEQVFFDGTLTAGQAVYNWLDNIDIYVHPSLKEGLPRALIEAMSRGCPAIASSIAGTPELLTNEYLTAPGDAKTLAEKLISMANSKDSMVNAAILNFNVAKKYSSPRLNAKRDIFWAAFANYALQKKHS